MQVATVEEEPVGDLVIVLNYSRTAVAALCFLLWDMIITIDDEIEYIWSRKWSLTDLAYISTRYIPLLAQIILLFLGPSDRHVFYPAHQCRYWQIYRGAISVVVLTSFDVLGTARVSALYHDYPRVRIGLLVLFAIEVACMVVGQTLGNISFVFDRSCRINNLPPTIRIYSSSSIAFQGILFFLTVIKFLENVRAGWSRIPLFNIIVRDGTWVFLFLLAAQFTVFYFAQNAFRRILTPWLWSVCSSCGHRMLLNVRKLAETESEDRIANIGAIPLSVIRSTHVTSQL